VGNFMPLGRCHDVTLPLTPTVLRYPGDPVPRIDTVASHQNGDPLMVSQLTVNCHVGTHVDAPAHFVADGATIDQLALECLFGPALVVSIDGMAPITPADLVAIPSSPRRHLILKTANSALLRRTTFDPAHRTVTREAAELLATLHPLSIGYDYYSLDPPALIDFPAHLVLAQAGIPVFLPLDLDRIEPGEYLFVGLPLPLVGVEAAPVRAMLFRH
jgi:arylformamidase